MNRLISVFFVTLFVLFSVVSCNMDQNATTDFAIETLAMAIGYELRGDFEWNASVDSYYTAIMEGKVSLEAAKLAEGYLRERTHPLIANRLVKLAGMVGFKMDDAGSLIGVDKVNIHLLQTAAQGFKQGLLLTDLKSDTIAYIYIPYGTPGDSQLLPMDKELFDSVIKDNQGVIALPAY